MSPAEANLTAANYALLAYVRELEQRLEAERALLRRCRAHLAATSWIGSERDALVAEVDGVLGL